MTNFFAELKRRHIYRVAAAYVVVAWALTQAIDVLSQVFELPRWIGQPAIMLLAAGFPVALFVAWTVESKPHQAIASAVRSKSTALDWTLMAALVAVIAIFGYQQLAASRSTRTAESPQEGVSTARVASAAKSAISLAVLPFVNLSSDAEQEFFADGMTEEITSALAKVKALNVVARTSAFEFKGQNKDVRTIAQALSASHLIEGSVRKAGTRVRITAQLIRADTGAHLWTDSYDRELKDIFATQEDIAQAIVGALQVPLGLKQGATLVSNRTIDPETYQDYLRARALARARTSDYGIALLEGIVKRDPNYAPAWALLANSYSLALLGTAAVGSGSAEAQHFVAELTPKQEAAAQRAIELDPNQADVATSLGQLQVRRGNFIMAEDLYSKALALDPSNANALLLRANLFAAVGHPKEGLVAMKDALTIEPFVPSYNSNAARHFWLNEQDDTAISMLNDLPANYPTRAASLAQIFASQGRYHDAADVLTELPAGTVLPETVEEAARLLRTAPKAAGSPRTLPRLGNLGFVYPYVGAPDRMLEYYEDAAQGGYLAAVTYAAFWHPSAAAVRKTERFRAHMRKSGLVDYWRARGWPEWCHPTTGDDFICE